MKSGVLISKSCPKNQFNSEYEFLVRGRASVAAGAVSSVWSVCSEVGIFGVLGVGTEIQKSVFNSDCQLGFARIGTSKLSEVELGESYLVSCWE